MKHHILFSFVGMLIVQISLATDSIAVLEIASGEIISATKVDRKVQQMTCTESLVIFTDSSNMIRFWDFFENIEETPQPLYGSEFNHKSFLNISSITAHPSGDFIANTTSDGVVREYSLEEKANLTRLVGSFFVYDLAYDPSGNFLYYVGGYYPETMGFIWKQPTYSNWLQKERKEEYTGQDTLLNSSEDAWISIKVDKRSGALACVNIFKDEIILIAPNENTRIWHSLDEKINGFCILNSTQLIAPFESGLVQLIEFEPDKAVFHNLLEFENVQLCEYIQESNRLLIVTGDNVVMCFSFHNGGLKKEWETVFNFRINKIAGSNNGSFLALS